MIYLFEDSRASDKPTESVDQCVIISDLLLKQRKGDSMSSYVYMRADFVVVLIIHM